MEDKAQKERLSKVMARAGVASRRHCEEIIFSGRVKVNGTTALLPQTMISSTDAISVDNKVISSLEPKVYYILNKPLGYICANLDPHHKKVTELFSSVPYRLFTVGRLDKETSGLLIVTNDGHFAQKVIHPSANLEKEYLAIVDEEPTSQDIARIMRGTEVEGVIVKPKHVELTGKGRLRIVIMEGKKREVRRILENAGFRVAVLHRLRIGSLTLDKGLKTGQWRPMTQEEKKLIFASAETQRNRRNEKKSYAQA